ncbi:type IV pilus biogenesis protein PilM [Photobacterium sp. DNB23_23_1]|uniref:Type IV pilus assembly protein PilM n=1 Tax=Photobacterium pectinilyticum TaxID=2906793 RepID=A0ABT1MX03_9GAMM|nr:type IV pilus assembly protein PilM [Photobacterium sp. ZSDE20]MCQ1056792.1 type IV pilus assembly protein PilM [Photobacterium sp. ZSDE20]MDD1820821.1 type IV pilus assembly protein PilM [Photobacterium sp. ZSDE20]
MFRNPLTIGVDIGHHSIKAVVLRQKKSGLELVAFAEVVLPAPVLNKQHSVNAPALLSAMRKLKKALPYGARQAVLALPDSAVISKVVQLDSHLTEDESLFAVEQAISASSPFPVEELRLDFSPMTRETFGEQSQTHPVQVYATRKETVDSRVAVMRQARLEPTVMELQTHVLVWLEQYLAEQQGIEGDWGIVDIGHTITAIGIKAPAGTVYRREVSFGGEAMEQIDNTFSGSGDSTARAEQFTKLLADNLKRQIQLYRTTYPRSALEGVWLSGDGQNLILEEMLARMLSLSVRKIHPLSGFQRSAKLDIDWEEEVYGQYAVAAGLAIRGASA